MISLRNFRHRECDVRNGFFPEDRALINQVNALHVIQESLGYNSLKNNDISTCLADGKNKDT